MQGTRKVGRKQTTSHGSGPTVILKRYESLLICLLIIFSTLAVYWQVKDYDFVDYDDGKYVAENAHVQQGLTSEGLVWAFTTHLASNWHPLTWLSHMLDIELFGLNPGRQHLVNLFFHILNSLLLFAVLHKMTGAPWRSGIAAALFALHPLHVESVAWIAERKDVLSTFFGMLTLWAYARYALRPTIGRYLPVLVFLALALMAKPMMVTLPFVLLLLDYWPLKRFGAAGSQAAVKGRRHPPLRPVREKTPLFVLVAISSFVTYGVQQQSGALRPLEAVPLGVRVFNALVSYVKYLEKIFWPVDLAVLYPYPTALDWWKGAAALLLLSALSIASVRMLRKRSYVAVGWFWFLGTLVPVIGLVQVGIQAMADRYTYFPSIGIFVVVVWGAADLGSKIPRAKMVLATAAAATLLLLAGAALNQVRYWQNSGTLFEHALAVTADNWLPHYNLACYLEKKGQNDAAAAQYLKTIRLKPDYEPAYNNLGLIIQEQGRLEEAERYFKAALDLNPDFEKARNNLGLTFEKEGRLDEAIEQYREALRIMPAYENAHFNLANSLHKKGLLDEAIMEYMTAIRLKPGDAAARNNLGIALFRKGDIDGAIEQFQAAVRMDPDFPGARINLRRVLAAKREGR